MGFSTRVGRPGERGFDTIEIISAAAAKALAASGFSFAVRYAETITRGELEALTGAGLGVMLAGYARVRDWSADTGRADGARVASKALAAGFPVAATLWCDQEGGVPDQPTAVAYATAWWRGATGAGSEDPGLYVGDGAGFDSGLALHTLIPFRRYWRSMSQVPNVAGRGYQVLQLYPPDQMVAGVRVDLDIIQSDYQGGLPVLCVAA
jgi:hypothetical protein